MDAETNQRGAIIQSIWMMEMAGNKCFPHQGKLVRDPPIRWKLGAEAQCRKHLVAVVVLDDLSDGSQRHGVVVQMVRAHVMERGGLGRVA